ncbi:MAG TPA: proline--tRNA ligase [Armatimonadetes bacterium]|nr:proline--tRNA ligase [Armatimonadota bacterium]
MRARQLFLPTLRQPPAEAELASHQLLVRAGFIRPVAAGMYAYLPLGRRALRRLECLVRKEMEAAGGQEVLLPTLQPEEWGQTTERGQEPGEPAFQLRDRRQVTFTLGPAQEGVVTALLARELRSYKQLPLLLYQVRTGFCDDPHPWGGLLRSREFILTDAYSFDRDRAGLEVSCQRIRKVYQQIAARCGLSLFFAEAAMGARKLLVCGEAGREVFLRCEACTYAATQEWAEARPSAALSSEEPQPLAKVNTPAATTVAEVTALLGVGPERLVKTLLYLADGEVVAALVRGDRELNETKLQAALGCRTLEMADADTVERVTSAPVGFAGPVGLKVPLLADPEVAALSNFVVGANAPEAHFVNANVGRDFTLDRVVPLRFATDGDGCPRCPGTLRQKRGFEIGQVRQLGPGYSEALGATFTDEGGREHPAFLGCYRLHLSCLLAAVAEIHHDERGLVWPPAVAPFAVHLLLLDERNPVQVEAAEHLYQELTAQGWEPLLDDRPQRPGVKFNDADLIGLPVQVVVGRKLEQKGIVEVRSRREGTVLEVSPREAVEAVGQML